MIRYTRRAQKDLAVLPEPMRIKAVEVAASLDENPTVGTKLRGKLEGKWAHRVGRSHRIIYEFVGSDVLILTISHRKDAYR